MGFLARMLRGAPPPTPEETDRVTVQKLAGMGADLSRPRRVIHFLEVGSEAAAHEVATAVRRAGYDASVEAEADATQWTVRAESVRVVDVSTVAAFRTWFEQLAAEHDCEYEGWEAWPKP
jgi:Regulator of ribonuclease activity B